MGGGGNCGVNKRFRSGLPRRTISELQATHCNTLHYTTTHCNTLQHTTTHCSTLIINGSTLQHTAAFYNTLQDAAVHANNLQKKATHVCFTQFWTPVVFLFACLFVSLSVFECHLHASLCVSLYVGLVVQEYITDIITYTTYSYAISFVLLEAFVLSHMHTHVSTQLTPPLPSIHSWQTHGISPVFPAIIHHLHCETRLDIQQSQNFGLSAQNPICLHSTHFLWIKWNKGRYFLVP